MRPVFLLFLFLNLAAGCADGPQAETPPSEGLPECPAGLLQSDVVTLDQGAHNVAHPAGGMWSGNYGDFRWMRTPPIQVAVQVSWNTTALGETALEVYVEDSENQGALYARGAGPSPILLNFTMAEVPYSMLRVRVLPASGAALPVEAAIAKVDQPVTVTVSQQAVC